jgi:hypothetical protein
LTPTHFSCAGNKLLAHVSTLYCVNLPLWLDANLTGVPKQCWSVKKIQGGSFCVTAEKKS